MSANKEIECRFLEINVADLKQRLATLNAHDHGEELLREIIFYDKELTYVAEHKLVRLRQTQKGVFLTYKHMQQRTVDGTIEIETKVEDMEKTRDLLVAIGLNDFRHQEKKRHGFAVGEVKVEIDTWPQIPPFVELEGNSEAELKAVAQQLGLDWEKRDTTSARVVIEDHYKIPVSTLRYFTFSRVE